MPEGLHRTFKYYMTHNLIDKNWGLPVDGIDRSCKTFSQCYDCIKMRDPECHADRIKYKYQLIQDEVTEEKSIICRKSELDY